MNTKLIKIGEKKYINPRHVVAMLERGTNIWVVRLRDGSEFVVEESYFDDLLRELT